MNLDSKLDGGGGGVLFKEGSDLIDVATDGSLLGPLPATGDIKSPTWLLTEFELEPMKPPFTREVLKFPFPAELFINRGEEFEELGSSILLPEPKPGNGVPPAAAGDVGPFKTFEDLGPFKVVFGCGGKEGLAGAIEPKGEGGVQLLGKILFPVVKILLLALGLFVLLTPLLLKLLFVKGPEFVVLLAELLLLLFSNLVIFRSSSSPNSPPIKEGSPTTRTSC